jgi:hypothetical protein
VPELAVESRKRDPHRSQDDVVEDISAWWQLMKPKKAPTRSILKPFISLAENDGRLPKAQKKPRKLRPVKRFT